MQRLRSLCRAGHSPCVISYSMRCLDGMADVARMMQKQKGSGILSAPKRPRCCARCPKPFTIFVSSLVVALVLIVGFMIGHFAAPYIQTMVSHLWAAIALPSPAVVCHGDESVG